MACQEKLQRDIFLFLILLKAIKDIQFNYSTKEININIFCLILYLIKKNTHICIYRTQTQLKNITMKEMY